MILRNDFICQLVENLLFLFSYERAHWVNKFGLSAQRA